MASTITFYQIINETKEKTLCSLIAKIFNSGIKATVRFKDETMLNQINKVLWSFNQKEFVPHGSKDDPMPERQPIYLTTGSENPNDSSLIIHCGDIESDLTQYERALFVFDNTNDHELKFARDKYKYFKAQQDINLEYWQQAASGTWEKIV